MAHRRRGVGIGRTGAAKYVSQKADELKAADVQAAIDTIETLEVKLTDFAQKHADSIQNDPVFRQRFLQMCGPLGVDPLLSRKKGGLWQRISGSLGDFYHELALQVAEVCVSTRSQNGGIMDILQIQTQLQKRTTKYGAVSKERKISTADINLAIEKLAKLGGGFRVVQVGNATMVVSVPTELDNDHMQVMQLAAETARDCGVTVTQVQQAQGWSKERAQRALDLLCKESMAWVDQHQGQTQYWFPSLWQNQQEIF